MVNRHTPLNYRDDPKLLEDDTGEVSNFEHRGWWFDSRIEIFSLLDGNQLAK